MSTFKRIEMTPTNKARSEKLRAELKKEIAAKGDIHFRIDPETYLMLADLAARKRMGVGVLARSMVMERLQQELKPAALAADDKDFLCDIRVLLDKCLQELQQANLRLGVFQGGKKESKPKPKPQPTKRRA